MSHAEWRVAFSGTHFMYTLFLCDSISQRPAFLGRLVRPARGYLCYSKRPPDTLLRVMYQGEKAQNDLPVVWSIPTAPTFFFFFCFVFVLLFLFLVCFSFSVVSWR